MKFFKCVLWAVKEYANVGIAVALFLLIGLQIEKQYRSTRYFENCIAQDWTFHSMISGKGYDLNFEPVDLSVDGDDIEARVGAMNKSIESLIRKLPEQYMWNYKRFKSSHSYR